MGDRLLIRSSGDWGDEFDLEGFCLIDADEWECVKEGIPDEYFEAYFGTNEFASFENRDEYLSHLEEIPISKEDEETLIRLLNLHKISSRDIITYGLFVISSSNW